MKGTRHNGRSGKNGVYNPLHNDRRFNPEHSEHIDNERVRQNIYWDCYQGYTTMEDQGKENNFSFEQIELAFYEEHYGNYVMKQNERHVKARHPDRCKEVEDVWKNKKTCPEESIYQLGTIDEHASVETLILVFDEFKKEFDERFGSNVHIIDWSLHMDVKYSIVLIVYGVYRVREKLKIGTTYTNRKKNVYDVTWKGEGFVDTAIKILMAVVIGALVLAGLYALFDETVLPTLTRRVQEMFSYSG